MSEPPLIYAFHGVVLLRSPILLVFSELHLPVSRSKNIRINCQKLIFSYLYTAQAAISILGTLI